MESEAFILELPDELLLEIIHLLNTKELIVLSRVCVKLNTIISDQHLLRCLDFRDANVSYKEINRFFDSRAKCKTVQALNLNFCHWLTGMEIKKLSYRLVNLQDLHILGISCQFTTIIDVLLKMQHLTSLSMSWNPTMVKNVKCKQVLVLLRSVQDKLMILKNLSFHLHLDNGDHKFTTWAMCIFIRSCGRLDVLNVKSRHCLLRGNDEHISSSLYSDYPDLVVSKTLLLQSVLSYPCSSNAIQDLFRNICAANNGIEDSICITFPLHWTEPKLRNSASPTAGLVKRSCSTLKSLYVISNGLVKAIPDCNFKALEKLFIYLHDFSDTPSDTTMCAILTKCSNLKSFGTVKLTGLVYDFSALSTYHSNLVELNLTDVVGIWPESQWRALLQLNRIKFLGLPGCSLHQQKENHASRKEKASLEPLLKKPRVPYHTASTSNCNPKPFFWEFVESHLHIEELEVADFQFSNKCVCSYTDANYHSNFTYLGKLRNLTYLTLASLPITDGSIFDAIGAGCLRLETLSIKKLGAMLGKSCFMRELVNCLGNLKYLKHFRLEQPNIEKLSDLLTVLHNSAIKRLFIECVRNNEGFPFEDVCNFPSFVPQLSFFGIYMMSATMNITKKTRTLIRSRYKVSHPQLSVIFTSVTAEKNENYWLKYPFWHEDIVLFNSQIGLRRNKLFEFNYNS